MQLHGHWLRPVFIVLLLCLFFPVPSNAYRVGEVVDTDMMVNSVATDSLRSQMPLFGVPSKTNFQLDDDARSFSLQFEDGIFSLPTIPLQQKGGALEKVEVSFVYSKSGGGAIHAVTCRPSYSNDRRRSTEQQRSFFRVEYQWIEEEAVYLSAGQATMFISVFVASIVFLLLSCDVMQKASTQSSSVPKWE
jgi:hypothetical protein